MKKIILMIILVVLLSACKRNDDIYNVNKKMSNMLSYRANAEIFIKGNRGMAEYKVRQYYSEPDKLRIETLEPEFLKGKIIVYSGGKWSIYHPLINNKLQVEKLLDDDELIYLGIIQKDMVAGENTEYNYASRNGIEYIAIKCNIPGGNEYSKSSVLYFTKKGYYPEFMEILDDKEDIRVTVRYYDFEYNSELKDSLFQLE